MSRKLILDEQALDDLREIASHYRGRGTNNDIEAWISGLVAAVEALAEAADHFPAAAESSHLRFDVRQKLYGSRQHKYRILFTVRGEAVRVLRVWHGARRRITPRDLPPIEPGTGLR
jgi:plasmid stabilization system protein ParE